MGVISHYPANMPLDSALHNRLVTVSVNDDEVGAHARRRQHALALGRLVDGALVQPLGAHVVDLGLEVHLGQGREHLAGALQIFKGRRRGEPPGRSFYLLFRNLCPSIKLIIFTVFQKGETTGKASSPRVF